MRSSSRCSPNPARLVGGSLIVVLLLTALAPRAHAQGLRDRLKKAAIERAGLGDAAEAARIARALAGFNKERNTPSPLAGTYRVTYTLNGRDSASLFIRTFDKPDIPFVDDPGEQHDQGHFSGGGLMHVIVALTVDSLPASMAAFHATIPKGGRSGRRVGHGFGHGFIMFMRDRETGIGAEGRYAMSVEASLLLSDSTNAEFWSRVGSSFMAVAAEINSSNAEVNDRLPMGTQVRRANLGTLVQVTTSGPIIVDYDKKTSAGDLVHVHAERISTTKLIR
jgi:hypothetical protein